MTNCFSLNTDGTVREGLPIVGDERDQYVPMSATGGIAIANDGLHYSALIIRDGLVLEAAPHYSNRRKQRLLTVRGSWSGALIYIADAESLDFSSARATYMGEVSGAWRGIETVEGLFAQSPDHRVQLCALTVGQTVAVADQHKRYLRVECRPDLSLGLSPADPLEFGRLLVARAVRKCFEISGLVWTRHALQVIGHSELWSSTLADREAQLRILSPRRRY